MQDPTKLEPAAAAPLSVVLLAWRPGLDLEATLAGWAKRLRDRSRSRRAGDPDEVVLIDDGSAPDVDGLLQRLGDAHTPVVWQRHTVPDGAGRMLAVGLEKASRPLVLYAPCNSAYQPDFLTELLAQIDPVHLVSGYRAGEPVPRPLRVLGALVRWTLGVAVGIWPAPLPGWLGWRGHAARWAARCCFGVHNSDDVGCPCRLVRREVLWRAPVQSRTSFAHVELLAKVNFQGCLLAEEVPLPVRPGEEGLPDDSFAARCQDSLRLFTRPDFGPPAQPVSAPPAEPGPLPLT